MPSRRFVSLVRGADPRESRLGSVCTDLLSLLLPGECGGCPSPALGGVCDQCLSECVPPRGPSCMTCGAPWMRSARSMGCGRCSRFGRPFAFDAAVSLWQYRGAARRIVHAFKYHARRDVLRPLGVRMARSARAVPVVAQGQHLLVVPVPARRKSRRQRGYDQALGLATGVASVLRAQLEPGALRRRRQPAQSQAETLGDPRRLQLRGSFRARRGRVLGRPVLLVDDVMSTGATVDAAARALGLAGAQAVFVLVLAG